MTTKELVGPLPTVRFQDGTRIAYQPPRDTCDGNRWRACTDHRVACDCREAEMAEQIAELRGELKAVADAALKVLAGHPIWVYEDGPNGEREVGCMCTGCQIVRASWVLPHHTGDSMSRDEVDGLSPMQLECGYRWKVCVERGGVPCRQSVVRDRGVYHEHLTDGAGNLVPLPEFDPMNEVPF